MWGLVDQIKTWAFTLSGLGATRRLWAEGLRLLGTQAEVGDSLEVAGISMFASKVVFSVAGFWMYFEGGADTISCQIGYGVREK